MLRGSAAGADVLADQLLAGLYMGILPASCSRSSVCRFSLPGSLKRSVARRSTNAESVLLRLHQH